MVLLKNYMKNLSTSFFVIPRSNSLSNFSRDGPGTVEVRCTGRNSSVGTKCLTLPYYHCQSLNVNSNPILFTVLCLPFNEKLRFSIGFLYLYEMKTNDNIFLGLNLNFISFKLTTNGCVTEVPAGATLFVKRSFPQTWNFFHYLRMELYDLLSLSALPHFWCDMRGKFLPYPHLLALSEQHKIQGRVYGYLNSNTCQRRQNSCPFWYKWLRLFLTRIHVFLHQFLIVWHEHGVVHPAFTINDLENQRLKKHHYIIIVVVSSNKYFCNDEYNTERWKVFMHTDGIWIFGPPAVRMGLPGTFSAFLTRGFNIAIWSGKRSQHHHE